MKTGLVCLLFCFFQVVYLHAQSVLYSSFVGNPFTTPFDVIGKAGNFYWVQKSKKPNSFRKRAAQTKDFSFEVYDDRLNRVNAISYTLSDSVLKQYLIAGNSSFDQLLLTRAANKTCVLLNRFKTDGTLVSQNDTLLKFPNSLWDADFLLARSEDKTKLLLLGFEPVEDAPPRVHAVLYNNWAVLLDTVYTKSSISQPFLQYDFTDYPLESFDNSPVKVRNNGDWLLVAPSRRSNNYVLWHYQSADSTVTQNEIRFTQRSGIQQVSLSLDESKSEATAGILTNTSMASVKRVRAVHYVLSQCHLDFDTTYRFSPFAAGKTKDENLFEQRFMSLPGKGFLFIKEYGRPFVSGFQNEVANTNDEDDTLTNALLQTAAAFIKNDYTRYANLFSAARAHTRGDLNLYFFPGAKGDTCWRGLLNQEQTSNLNAPFLSYACVPLNGKIILLYNRLNRHDAKSATTTFLDEAGHSLNEGVIFWQFNNVLNFQMARQIAVNEVAVPYEKNGGWGFAVIRL